MEQEVQDKKRGPGHKQHRRRLGTRCRCRASPLLSRADQKVWVAFVYQ